MIKKLQRRLRLRALRTRPKDTSSTAEIIVFRILALIIPIPIVWGIVAVTLKAMSNFAFGRSLLLIFFLAVIVVIVGIPFGLTGKLSSVSNEIKNAAVGWFNVFFSQALVVAHILLSGFLESRRPSKDNRKLAAVVTIFVLLGSVVLLNVTTFLAERRVSNMGTAATTSFWTTWLYVNYLGLSAICSSKDILSHPSVPSNQPMSYDLNRLLGPFDASASSYRVAHLSDLHVSLGKRLTEDDIRWNSRLFDSCVEKVKTMAAGRQLQAVVISGDITDTGRRRDWVHFHTCISRIHLPCIIAPGNHDLSIVGFGAGSLLSTGDRLGLNGQWLRLKNYFEKAVEIMGPQATVRSGDGTRLDTLDDSWKALMSDDSLKFDKQRLAAARKLFPIFVRPATLPKTCFVVWNSVRPSTLALNNSAGEIGRDQMSRFTQTAGELCDTVAFIHVVHHKLALPSDGIIWTLKKSKIDQIKRVVQVSSMMMNDSGIFVRGISQVNRRTIVFHGHHHSSFALQMCAGGVPIEVLSAPSTLLGVESSGKNMLTRPNLGFDVVHVLNSNGNPFISGLHACEILPAA